MLNNNNNKNPHTNSQNVVDKKESHKKFTKEIFCFLYTFCFNLSMFIDEIYDFENLFHSCEKIMRKKI